MDDINKCRVPRDYLEKWSNEPFFEKAVKGCFVRVSRGTDRRGRRLYAMAEIVGVGPYKRRYKIVRLRFISLFDISLFSSWSERLRGQGRFTLWSFMLEYEGVPHVFWIFSRRFFYYATREM